jgi:predicted ribosomally synthesized peptide with SipW-like signal peptide
VKKKVLWLALALLLVAGMTGAGTFAYFSDTETSTGNTFTAGTLDLQVSDDSSVDPDPWGDGVDLTWVMNNMVPGGSSVTNTVSLQNVGSVQGNHVEISFSHTLDENPVESDTNPNSQPGDLAKWLEITAMQYDGVNILPQLVDANGNGWIDLEDVTLSANTVEDGPLDNLPSPEAVGGTGTLSMTISFRAEATNDIQGDILTTTVFFTLNQDASQ